MTDGRKLGRLLAGGGALCIVALLGGCGGGVELNGKLFDAMGVSSKSATAQKIDPIVPERTGLVLPPSNQLPVPGGSAVAVAAPAALPAQGGEQWPVDPDQQLAALQAQQQAEQAANCDRPDPSQGSEGLKQHKYVRCGSIWTALFNSDLDQPENAQGLKPIMQQPKAIMVPAGSGTIPAPAPDETATVQPQQ